MIADYQLLNIRKCQSQEYIRPGGSTLLQSGDKLMILADRPEDFKKVEKILKLGPDTF